MIRLSKGLTVSLLSMASTSALAQEIVPPLAGSPPPASLEEAEPPAGEITVTGTRIRQDGFGDKAPTLVVDESELETSGFTDLGQVLADQPGVELVDSTVGVPNGGVQNSGIVSIDLRDLGSARTLTLINGRRSVSNAANRNVVSLNTIPVDFVERIEVITGGTSAIYGSDAIAGVVNIITESNFEGVRLRGRLGTALTGGGGAEEVTLAGTIGKKFADGRGYFVVSASYDDDGGLLARDRLPDAARSWTFSPTSNVVTEPSLSTDLPGGRFRGGPFWFDESGLRTDFATSVHGYNDRIDDVLRVPRTTKAVAAKLKFEVSDAFVPYAEVQFSRMNTLWHISPIGWRDDSTARIQDNSGVSLPDLGEFTVGRISRDNPYVPALIRFGIPGGTAAPASGITWRRRFMELGNREYENERDTLRVWAGATGKLGGGWTYEAGYSFGEFSQYQERRNFLNLGNLQQALNAERIGDEIRCRDAAARAAGCVPINIFGVGTITPEAAEYIRLNSVFNATQRQHDILAYATGPLFRLPAGPVGLAVGVEYRDESISAGSDPETLASINNVTSIPTFSGSFNVKEAFAEISVPLLRNKPFFESLTIDAAGRVAHYSQRNVGTVFSYQAGASWEPVDGLRLRGRYGVAQRAPNLTELYSPPRDDTDTITDLCSGVTANTAGTIAQNCRSVPGINAAIAASGVFTQDTTSIFSPNTGNLALKEETGRSITAGVVFSPRAIRGLNVSFDYYRIRVDDAIAPLDNAVLLRNCYSDGATFATNSFCEAVVRDQGSGQISQIRQVPQNLDRMTVSGFDLAARYRFRLSGIGLPGRLELRANWNHVIEDSTEYQGLNGIESTSDLRTMSAPQDQVRASVEYSDRFFEAEWRVRYIGPVVASNERVAAAAAAGIVDPLYLNYPAYWRHDFSASISPRFGGMRWRLTLGVNNLFNNVGPIVPASAAPGVANGFIARYGVVGRTGYVSARIRL